MAGIQVKASRRNGRIVKAHTRRGRAIRKAAIGVAGAGAIAGGGLLLKKRLGVKTTGSALGRSIRIDGRAAAMGRTGRAGSRQQREVVAGLQRKLGLKGQMRVQSELQAFDRVASAPKTELDPYRAWVKLSPEAKKIGLANMAESGGVKEANKFKKQMLRSHRRVSPELIARESGFDTVKAYVKHHSRGGDVAGRTINRQQIQKLTESARSAGGGKSAAGIRANIKRDLGFSGNPTLTHFSARRWRKI